MRSSFFGLNIATQGLYTAKSALDVTNHNIVNAETEGYSRQEAIINAQRPLGTNIGKGMIGTGSEFVGVERHREYYLDVKYRSANDSMGEYEVKYERMQELEALFNEPSDSGFNTAFDELFASLQDLSKNAGDYSYKSAFVEQADTFVEYFNTISTELSEYQRDINFSVKTKIDEINNISSQIQRLNKQIFSLELNGDFANDLRDERDVLVDDLSKIVNTEAKETIDADGIKRFSVTINGESLVDHYNARYLEIESREVEMNPEDEIGLYDVKWSTGQTFDLHDSQLGGELRGYIDIRDGNNNMNLSGTVSGVTSTTMTISEPSRTDILSEGEITIDNRIYSYDSFSYDETTGNIIFSNISPDPTIATNVGDKIEMGDSIEFKGIPYYQQKLNEFVRTFANEFNSIHKQGQTEEGDFNKAFFTFYGSDENTILDENAPSSYNVINASNFMISKDITDDVDNFATSYNINSGESDNSLINDLINLKHDIPAFDNGEPANYMQAIIGEMAVDTNKSKTFYDNQLNIATIIDNQRMSNSGVDLNEETQNMVKFQQAYNVAAKMMSVMDEIYDVTINQLGS